MNNINNFTPYSLYKYKILTWPLYDDIGYVYEIKGSGNDTYESDEYYETTEEAEVAAKNYIDEYLENGER